MINATGDCVASMMVARRVEGKGWMEKSIENSQELKVDTTV